ncbi:hypothetical protein HDV06_001277 [Boothiomyces sp. JEL0866]|nr:hypothetical protein HDV06_001277 [Boothiomyces sp. JEL0866]
MNFVVLVSAAIAASIHGPGPVIPPDVTGFHGIGPQTPPQVTPTVHPHGPGPVRNKSNKEFLLFPFSVCLTMEFTNFFKMDKTALVFGDSTITFKQLKQATFQIKRHIKHKRIAILCSKTISFVASLLAVFGQGVAVPICSVHPIPEMQYTIQNSECTLLLYSKEFQSRAKELESLGIDLLLVDELISGDDVDTTGYYFLDGISTDDEALIMYTSGTTGKPKGVVHTIKSLLSQVNSLTSAWDINANDYLLHILPVHHIHGIVNALLTLLVNRATVELLDFNIDLVWSKLPKCTLFMAVPTIYSKLLSKPQTLSLSTRLFVSGSAALPSPIKTKWKELTGHVILERYGMTEIGMALSCGMALDSRIDNSVGRPLPGVTVVLDNGEILVSSDNLFKEYYKKPTETDKEIVFVDGKRFFRTGDIGYEKDGVYFIEGRRSMDIIKSGGYKISALEIEREILSLEGIKECCVLGLDDQEWGQVVVALVVSDTPVEIESFRKILKEKLATYKVPKIVKNVKEIPRNVMGKINKKELVLKFHDL